MDPSPSSPTSVGDLQNPNSPASPLPEIGTTDHSPSDTDSGTPSGVSPQMPSSFPVDLSPNLPPNLSIQSPCPTPAPPSSNPGTAPTHPPLVSAGNGAFNLTGVLGDFISECTCTYWESVPGGERWIAMVTSYLRLQTMPPLKDVSAVSCLTTRNQLIPHLATSATSSCISATRVANLVENQEAFS